MTHLDEARLLTLRDGNPGADPVGETHLAECSPCQVVLERLRGRSATIAGALATLDDPHDPAAARARIQDRVVGRQEGATSVTPLRRRRPGLWGVELSRAAGILLVTATAAAAALPGSPVHQWVRSLVSSEDGGGPSEAVSAPASLSSPGAPEAAGIRLSLTAGPLRVSLMGVAEGSEVRVQWVPGAEAAVFAPVGSQFTSGESRIEATVLPGTVRVELPGNLVPVSLEVNGRTYLRKAAEGLEVLGPAEVSGPQEIVFRVPGG
jgi:hypothetical protein